MDLTEIDVRKRGNLFVLTGRDGRLPLDGDHPLGLYRDDCRFLSGRELGAPMRAERAIVSDEAMEERVVLRGPAEVELRVEADFEPMLAIRGHVPRMAHEVRREPVAGGVRLSVAGRDGVQRSTTVTAEPALPARLAAGEEWRGTLRYRVFEEGVRPAPPAPAPAVAVRSDDERLDRLLARSFDDLAMLRSTLDGQPYVVAGTPWYANLFGRDSLIAALQVLAFDPGLARGTLRVLAARLGRAFDDAHDEEPGKVLHEWRAGEVANLGLSPFTRYYGTVDATPLFLVALGSLGDLALFRELRPAVEAALAWCDRFDGFLTYARRAPGGLVNQCWKDSPDGLGAPVEPPVAVVEAQGYLVDARRRIATLFERDGDPARASALRAAAAALAARLGAFRHGDGYAMALDGAGRPVPGVGSNQGHLLWSGAVDAAGAAAVRAVVMSEEMFSGWGIRTLAADDPQYDPTSYHRGSVWPHDTALIAAGLRHYGHDGDFLRLFEALLDAAAQLPGERLPELFGGQAGAAPVPYPVACIPQAWAAGTLPYLLAAGLLGERPLLPGAVRRLEVEGEHLHLRAERVRGEVRVTMAAS